MYSRTSRPCLPYDLGLTDGRLASSWDYPGPSTAHPPLLERLAQRSSRVALLLSHTQTTQQQLTDLKDYICSARERLKARRVAACENSIPPLLSMCPSLTNLPDEVLGLIFSQVASRALQAVSLVCKQFRKLVLPQLFAKLNLAELSASVAGNLHEDLFGRRDNQTRGSLADQHLRILSYSFIESCLDEEEFAAKNEAVHQILDATRSISTLEIEFVLSEHRSEVSDNLLYPAIKEFFISIENKVDAIEISLDVEGTMVSIDEEVEDNNHGILTRKIAILSKLILPDKVRSLRFIGVAVQSLSPELIQTLQSSSLKRLSLQDCNRTFDALPVIPQLEDLKLSWGGEDEDECALAAAHQICSNSALTLKSLTLQNVLARGQSLLPKGWSTALALPELSQLRLSDWHSGNGSLLDTVLSHAMLPALRTLILDTEDILNGAVYVTPKLDALPKLCHIRFVESGRKLANEASKPDGSPFEYLHVACETRGVAIECTVKSRCDSTEELEHEFQRLEILADTITSLSLTLQVTSLNGIDGSSAQLLLSSVETLAVTLSDSIIVGPVRAESNDSPTEAKLKALLTKFICPNVRTIQATLLVNSSLARPIYEGLKDLLCSGMYPVLECLAGAIMAAPYMSSGELESLRSTIEAMCQTKNIDCSGITYISRENLGCGNNDHEDCITSDEEDALSDDDDEDVDENENEDAGNENKITAN